MKKTLVLGVILAINGTATGGIQATQNNHAFGNKVNLQYPVNNALSKDEIRNIATTLVLRHPPYFLLSPLVMNRRLNVLVSTITVLSQGQGVLGTQKQITQALTELKQGNTNNAKTLFADFAKKGKRDKHAFDGYLNLATLILLEDNREAKPIYQHAVNLMPEIAQGWIRLGQSMGGNVEGALSAYQTALKLAEKQGNKNTILEAYRNIGNIYYGWYGKQNNAIIMYNKALTLDKSRDDKEGMAEDYNSLGFVYAADTFVFDNAIAMYEKSSKLYEALNDKVGVAKNDSSLGNIYQQSKELDKAIVKYELALKIYTEQNRQDSMIEVYNNLATVYQEKQDFTKAIKMIESVIKIHEALSIKKALAEDYRHLGEIYVLQGQFSKAIVDYEQALKLHQELKDESGLEVDYMYLAGAYAKKGDKVKSEFFSRKSQEHSHPVE